MGHVEKSVAGNEEIMHGRKGLWPNAFEAIACLVAGGGLFFSNIAPQGNAVLAVLSSILFFLTGSVKLSGKRTTEIAVAGKRVVRKYGWPSIRAKQNIPDQIGDIGDFSFDSGHLILPTAAPLACGSSTIQADSVTPFKMRTILSIVLLVAILFALSGCGGDMPTSATREGEGSRDANFTALIPSAVHRAAQASPTPGSVTQGSAVLQGVTADKISVTFAPFSGGVHPVASIRTGDGTTLTSNEDPTREIATLPSGGIVYFDPTKEKLPEGISGHYPQEVVGLEDRIYFSPEFEERWGIEGGYGCAVGAGCAEMEKQREAISLGRYLDHPDEGRSIRGVLILDLLGGGSFGENEDGSTKVIGNPSGMIVDGYTDYDSDESDYLAWGTWYYYRFTPSDVEFTFGAFADGVETAFTDVPSVGTASYSGYSSGLATKGATLINRDNVDEAPNGFGFVAEINLTADFANASVSGTAGNFRAIDTFGGIPPAIVDEALDDDGFLHGLVIHLDSAGIRSSGSDPEHSFFEGSAGATGLSAAAGKWGGQFFGSPGTGEAPPAVGGTWGVTQGEGTNDWRMIGGFGAWKKGS